MILLDEIEKAHPEVWNVLLQVMDDGRLTDGEGRTVDFTNAVVVMTSNLGAGKAKRGVGFTAAARRRPTAERMLAAAKAAFLPEFLNRIDEIVTFESLTPEQVERIARQMVDRVADRLRARARDRAGGRRRARRAAGARGLRRGSSAPARCSATCAARWRRS